MAVIHGAGGSEEGVAFIYLVVSVHMPVLLVCEEIEVWKKFLGLAQATHLRDG